MKRLIIAIILMLVIYVLGTQVADQIKIYIQHASLMLAGVDSERTRDAVRTHFNAVVGGTPIPEDAHISIKPVAINLDDTTDIIATIESPRTCGSGGCLTAIFLQNANKEFRPTSFAYTLKDIEVQSGVTSGMHDLMINEDPQNLMRWDGAQYTQNTI